MPFRLASLVGPDSLVPGVVFHEDRIEGLPRAMQMEAEVNQECGSGDGATIAVPG
jgi:hypothetical protein